MFATITAAVASMFFSFDGIDGAGKSTQVQQFCNWLGQRGEVVACRDPGGTALGERVRELLLGHSELQIGARAEMLLYMASRAQLVEQIIAPALGAGQVVVSDRYLLSNVVYQGYAGGLDVAELWQVGQIATARTLPDLTFVLDMPTDEAMARIGPTPDRMEARGIEFLQRVREGFLQEAAGRPDIVVVDAAREIDVVQAEIRAMAESVWQGEL